MASKRSPLLDLIKALALAVAVVVIAALLFGCQKPNLGNAGARSGVGAPEKDIVYVYIPCGMREPFDHAIPLFNESQSEVQVKGFYDNAIVLVEKIKAGDTPDLVVSPGKVEMEELVSIGKVNPDLVTDIGTYTLALIVPRENSANVQSLEDLKKPEVKNLAIAEPEHNSVGFYAKESLINLGLWEDLKAKAVSPSHALDVITFTAKEKVDATIAYETCPLKSAPEKADKERLIVIGEIPQDSHTPILVKIGVLTESHNPEWAQKFAQFLTTEEVQAAFQDSGLPRLSNLDNTEEANRAAAPGGA